MTLSDNPIVASYVYLLEPEIRFLEAAVEHLIPTDELGPGARDAGVVVYIDRQLAGTWGVHGRQYRGGPWLEGTPQQGYQSRFTPQEVYRIAIARSTSTAKPRSTGLSRSLPATSNCACSSKWRRTRSRCLRCHRNSSSICCGATPRRGSSPIRCTAATATKWVGSSSGSPACPAANTAGWSPASEPYHAEPVSVLDVQTGKVPVDAEGFPKHVIIKRNGES